MIKIVLAASVLMPWSTGPWFYYDTGLHACTVCVSPADMLRFDRMMGHHPVPRYDGKRILVMPEPDATQGLIFYRSKEDCEADGRT